MNNKSLFYGIFHSSLLIYVPLVSHAKVSYLFGAEHLRGPAAPYVMATRSLLKHFPMHDRESTQRLAASASLGRFACFLLIHAVQNAQDESIRDRASCRRGEGKLGLCIL